jgi:predicted peptidase
MKLFFKTAVFLSLITFASLGRTSSGEPAVHTLAPELQQKTECLNSEYLVFIPKQTVHTNVPLLIFLHGAGGTGEDIRRIKGQPLKVWKGIHEFDKGPCIVVAPQCLPKTKAGERGTWSPEDLDILLQDLKATLPIDHTRIYLTGTSMGGYGSWVWGAHNPEHFAAIAPVVGGIGQGGPKDVTPDLDAWAANLAKVPVYAFVGAKDHVVPPDRSARMIEAIRNAGGKNAQLRSYPDEGHGAGKIVYSTAEFYDWMFSRKRD